MIKKTIAVGGLVALVAAGYAVAPHFDRNEYIATVTGKGRVTKSEGVPVSDVRYIVFLKLPNGDERAFDNYNSWIEFKFDDSTNQIQEQLELGKTYRIGTYSKPSYWRRKIQNIVSVQPINK
jgi:hypothetical protein